eukprot:CFRG3058T1
MFNARCLRTVCRSTSYSTSSGLQNGWMKYADGILPCSPTWSVQEVLDTQNLPEVEEEVVLKAANFAHISLDRMQLGRVSGEVNELVHFIQHIQDQQTKEISPTFSVMEHTNNLRNDDSQGPFSASGKHITEHASIAMNNFFVVK